MKFLEYPKIETIFSRDEDFNVRLGEFKREVFSSILLWNVTEKIDGKSVRVTLDAGNTSYVMGREQKSMLSSKEIKFFEEKIPNNLLRDAFKFLRKNATGKIEKQSPLVPEECVSITIYGELYGNNIQESGKYYNPNLSFRIFDILVDDKKWFERDEVEEYATKLKLKTVPFIGKMTMQELVDLTKNGFSSKVSAEENNGELFNAEGIVARPLDQLFDSEGNRIIVKLKTRDFINKPKKSKVEKTRQFLSGIMPGARYSETTINFSSNPFNPLPSVSSDYGTISPVSGGGQSGVTPIRIVGYEDLLMAPSNSEPPFGISLAVDRANEYHRGVYHRNVPN